MTLNILDIAIHKDISSEERRKLRIVNFTLFVIIFINAFLLFFFIINNRPDLVLIDTCLVLLCSGITYILMKKRKYIYAKYYITISFPPILFALNLLYGDISSDMYFTSLALLTLLLIDSPKLRYIMIGWCTLWYFGYFITIKELNLYNAVIDYTDYKTITRYYIYISGFFINIILMRLVVEDNKNYEYILKTQNENLSELNKDKNKFLSILSHDLRTPFSTILSLIGIFKQNINDYSRKELSQKLECLYETTQNSLSMLEDLLCWSRLIHNNSNFNPTDINLHTIAKRCYSQLDFSAKQKEININLDIDKELYVAGDPSFLQTTIRNLLSNAIKFTPQGGTINISSHSNSSMPTVCIKDSGVGIKEDNQKKLFKIGAQISTRGTNNEKGSGLGLILCKEFVERNGGSIWLESNTGQGTSFFFTIPSSKKQQL